MPSAYVLINCELGSEDEIIRELQRVPEVVEVKGVFGVYDIITKLTAESSDKLKEIISTKIRRITKIRSTLTMMVIEGQGNAGLDLK